MERERDKDTREGGREEVRREESNLFKTSDTSFLPASGMQKNFSLAFTHDPTSVANQTVNSQVEVIINISFFFLLL